MVKIDSKRRVINVATILIVVGIVISLAYTNSIGMFTQIGQEAELLELTYEPVSPSDNIIIFNAKMPSGVVASKIAIFVDNKYVSECVGVSLASCSFIGGPYVEGIHNFYSYAVDSNGQLIGSLPVIFNV